MIENLSPSQKITSFLETYPSGDYFTSGTTRLKQGIRGDLRKFYETELSNFSYEEINMARREIPKDLFGIDKGRQRFVQRVLASVTRKARYEEIGKNISEKEVNTYRAEHETSRKFSDEFIRNLLTTKKPKERQYPQETIIEQKNKLPLLDNLRRFNPFANEVNFKPLGNSLALIGAAGLITMTALWGFNAQESGFKSNQVAQMGSVASEITPLQNIAAEMQVTSTLDQERKPVQGEKYLEAILIRAERLKQRREKLINLIEGHRGFKSENEKQRFLDKLIKVSENLDPVNKNPDLAEHMLKVMIFESGLSSSEVNQTTGEHVGSIQFSEETLSDMGITKEEMLKLSITEQLTYVERYYKPYAADLDNLRKVALATLLPAYIEEPPNYGIIEKGTIEYTQNFGLDLNEDGVVTSQELAIAVEAKSRTFTINNKS